MDLQTIKSHDGGSFDVTIGLPRAEQAPAIVIVPHILGVNHSMIDAGQAYVDRGFIVVMPDVFWRILPGPLPYTDEDRAKARDRGKRADVTQCLADIKSVIDMLPSLPQYGGRFAVVGYCFGGRYALLGASRLGASAAGSFHGVGMREYLSEVSTIDVPVSFHFGEADPAVPLDEVTEIRAAFANKEAAEICVYPGVAHNFAIPGMPGYNASADSASKSSVLRMVENL
jgi:carboxymethylenebutenolidase